MTVQRRSVFLRMRLFATSRQLHMIGVARRRQNGTANRNAMPDRALGPAPVVGVLTYEPRQKPSTRGVVSYVTSFRAPCGVRSGFGKSTGGLNGRGHLLNPLTLLTPIPSSSFTK